MNESLELIPPGYRIDMVDMDDMNDAIETYQEFLERYISASTVDLRFASFLRMQEAKCQYQEALENIRNSPTVRRIKNYLARSLYLLNVKKTIEGLELLASQHAVRRSSISFLPLSLLRRVRLLTVTHPAIAPPQFV